MASPYGHNFSTNTSIVQQVLFNGDSALFGVYIAFDFAHPELDVQVGPLFHRTGLSRIKHNM
jgi:hypothetical protein